MPYKQLKTTRVYWVKMSAEKKMFIITMYTKTFIIHSPSSCISAFKVAFRKQCCLTFNPLQKKINLGNCIQRGKQLHSYNSKSTRRDVVYWEIMQWACIVYWYIYRISSFIWFFFYLFAGLPVKETISKKTTSKYN